jgi:hypothetical protein
MSHLSTTAIIKNMVWTSSSREVQSEIFETLFEKPFRQLYCKSAKEEESLTAQIKAIKEREEPFREQLLELRKKVSAGMTYINECKAIFELKKTPEYSSIKSKLQQLNTERYELERKQYKLRQKLLDEFISKINNDFSQVGNGSQYIYVLGRNRKIYIEGRRKFVTYRKEKIPLTDAKKLQAQLKREKAKH